MRILSIAALVAMAALAAPATAVTLYVQDFENPDGFVNDGGDINIFRSINQLYHDQPTGFVFSQTFTTETLLIGGTQAFGTGYKDPQAIGGKYVVAQLSDVQDDRLGMAFNVGAFQFLNIELDISGIDLDRFGGPFVPVGGAAPVYRFSLFDNPTGAPGVSTGTLLDSFNATAAFNPLKNTFNWSHVINGLNAAASTNGNVILQIDILSGGYGAFDNIRVSAENVQAGVPEASTWTMMIAGFGLAGMTLRRRARRLPAIG